MFRSSYSIIIQFDTRHHPLIVFFFFFNDTATTEIYTLSLHDALPISVRTLPRPLGEPAYSQEWAHQRGDRKSTRLNSSHLVISYAVFCLKKKKKYKSRRFVMRTTSSMSTTP